MHQESASAEGEQPDLNYIFSLRKPRDAKAGFASGAKSVAKGVVAGAVGLFAAPILGAHADGFSGFAKGAAAGVAGAVLLPVAGVAVGAAQVVRGIANSPQAWREQSAGKTWDREAREWINAPTLALTINDGATAHLRHPHRGASGGAPGAALDDYYGLLGVPRVASAEEIKRAYYVAARRLHPDKNPGDPTAHQRFQALAEAYQVLGNEELRRRYDAHGAEGLDVNFVDGAEFFAALFGSDRFEHLVGELMLAAAARAGPDLTAAGMRRVQATREARLEVLLAALLRRYVEGDEEGFRGAMKAEAASLATASFGEVMLHTIGRVYEVQATIYLGGVLDGSLAALRAKGRSLRTQFKAATLALKVYQAQQQIARVDAEAERAQGEAAKARLRKEEEELKRELQRVEREETTEEGEDTAAQPMRSTTTAASGAAASAGASSPGAGSSGTAARHPASTSALHSPEELTAAAVSAAAERARLEEDTLPLLLEAMWAANVMDIEQTLRHVCRRVLSDPKISKEQRRARAQALLELGRTLRAASGPPGARPVGSSSSQSAKQKMEAAMLHMMEKRMQADDTVTAWA